MCSAIFLRITLIVSMRTSRPARTRACGAVARCARAGGRARACRRYAEDVLLGHAAGDAGAGRSARCRRRAPSRSCAPGRRSLRRRSSGVGADPAAAGGGVAAPPARGAEPAPGRVRADRRPAAGNRLDAGGRRRSARPRPSSPAPIIGDDAVDRNGLAFLDLDLEQHAGAGRRDLRVHLVGRDLEQRLVACRPASPTFLIQRTIVPSAIDSPIWGITTSVDIDTPTGRARASAGEGQPQSRPVYM